MTVIRSLLPSLYDYANIIWLESNNWTNRIAFMVVLGVIPALCLKFVELIFLALLAVARKSHTRFIPSFMRRVGYQSAKKNIVKASINPFHTKKGQQLLGHSLVSNSDPYNCPQLPVELMDQILSMSDPSSVAAAIRGSRNLLTIGRRALYRSVTNDKFGIRRTRLLLKTLSQKNDLAVIVRVLSLRLPPQFKENDWTLLKFALSQTINLHRLDLPFPRYKPGLLSHTNFPQLRTLAFIASPETPHVPFGIDFLSRHPTIRTLSITGNSQFILDGIPTTTLPKLINLNLTCPLHLRYLLPGRPIRYLSISLLHQARSLSTTDLIGALENLSSTSADTLEEINLDLQSGLGAHAAGVLQSLAYLAITRLTLTFIRHASPSIHQLTSLVTTLPCIRYLSVTQTPAYSFNIEEEPPVLDWFILCEDLEEVYFVDRGSVHRSFTRRKPTNNSQKLHAHERGGCRVSNKWQLFDQDHNSLGEDVSVEWKLVGYIWEKCWDEDSKQAGTRTPVVLDHD